MLGFRGLTLHDPDRFALEVIAQLLAGQGGRLFLELRDRRGLAYAVNAMNIEGLAPGLFAVYVATAPEKLDEAKDAIFAELRTLLDASAAGRRARSRAPLSRGQLRDRPPARRRARRAHGGRRALRPRARTPSAATRSRWRRSTPRRCCASRGAIVDLDAYTLATTAPAPYALLLRGSPS